MTHADIQNWIENYVKAWRENNTAMLTNLFSDEVNYKETPWKPAVRGITDLMSFWKQSCARQGNFQLQSKIVALENATAVVRLNVEYESDTPALWRDLWLLTFNKNGKCNSFEGWPTPKEQDGL